MKLAFAILGLFALSQLELQANEFRNFRIPNSRVVQTRFSFSTEFDRTMNDSEFPNVGKSTEVAHDAVGSFYHMLLTESDRQSTMYSLSGNLAEAVRRRESNHRDYWYGNSSTELYRRYNFGTGATARFSRSWFLWAERFGLTFNTFGRARYLSGGSKTESYEQGWQYYYDDEGNYRQSYGEEWYDRDSEGWDQDYDFEARGGPVFGRVRNVTPVADALIMELRLIEDKVLSGPLTHETRQALAQIISQRDIYEDRYDYYRSRKHYWSDIESVLRSDPAFTGELTAYSIIRLDEYYLGDITRYSGFTFTPYISYGHSNLIRHSWQQYHTVFAAQGEYYARMSENYDRWHYHTDGYYWGANLRWGIPFGLAWQYEFEGTFRHTTNADFGREPSVQSWYSTASNSLYWIMADKWFARGRFGLSHDISDEVGDYSNHHNLITASLAAEVSYRVESRVALGVSIYDGYAWEERRTAGGYYNPWDPPLLTRRDGRETHFRIGLTYALRGPVFDDYFNYYWPYSE